MNIKTKTKNTNYFLFLYFRHHPEHPNCPMIEINVHLKYMTYIYSPGLDRARAPPHAPCFVEVRDKYAPCKMFTLLRQPGNRTVCKKEELFCFLFFNISIK